MNYITTETEETRSSKIIDEIYDILERNGIVGEDSRDFFWRQLAAEYTFEIINGKMTQLQVLNDINRANTILIKYVTEAFQKVLTMNGSDDTMKLV